MIAVETVFEWRIRCEASEPFRGGLNCSLCVKWLPHLLLLVQGMPLVLLLQQLQDLLQPCSLLEALRKPSQSISIAADPSQQLMAAPSRCLEQLLMRGDLYRN